MKRMPGKMSEHNLQLSEIQAQKWLEEPDWLNKTRDQMRKDFERSGITWQRKFENQIEKPGDLWDELLSSIQNLVQMEAGKLSSLLYNIDLSELQIAKYRKAHPELTDLEMISELIVKRELQKVLIRHFYRAE